MSRSAPSLEGTGRGPAAFTMVALISAALVGLVVLALVLGGRSSGGTEVDTGFARDMSEHHAQAVDMSLIVLQASDSQDIDVLAYDIATTQSNQIGRMQQWLTEWGAPMGRTDDRMSWMPAGAQMGDMAGMDEAPPGAPGYRAMPGMATLAEMDELRSADPAQAEVVYLQLMTTHHLAGVEMAQAALDHAEDQDVTELAQAMVAGQRSEVALMNDLLTQREAAPREDLAALGY